ncbi:hypothetical protein FRB91_000388 [Serendipita sp. 411]|nr:hypothetical protein FRB91_000388 [Serendipita sp. 411]
MARSARNQSWGWILINMFLFLQVVLGYHNVTIDDTDPAIVYRGAWSTATREECYGGSCHFTTINGVTALYPLSGAVRLYFVGQILLDSTIKVVIDGLILVPAIAESSPQGILWDSGMQFNPSKQYIIQVEKAGPSGTGREFYVDAFIKTVPDEGEFPTTSTSNTKLLRVIFCIIFCLLFKVAIYLEALL